MNPILTIAIPTYNRKKYLKECLDHVIPQVGEDIELIVCDNASEDGTDEFMEYYCQKYSFIKYLRNKKNIGPDGNFLRCLREGKGEFIHLLSDDDILLDGSINEIKNCILNYHNLSFIYLNHIGFEGKFNVAKCTNSTNSFFNDKENILFNNKNLVIEYLWIYATFVSSMIFNKKIFEKIDYPEQYLGTYLLQAHILFNVISIKENCVLISKTCIAARGENSGGYNVYKVFSYYWKKVLFDTGIKKGYSKKSLRKIYNKTIKNFLRGWIIKMKIETETTNYVGGGYWLLFQQTYSYPSAWIYLYPFILMPSRLISKLKKLKTTFKG